MRRLLLILSRRLGSLVCKCRGCRYDYGGAICSWRAYGCVRCGELDRPLESLPYAPSFEDDDYPHWLDDNDFDQQEADRFRRWFTFLPFPRWL